MTPSLARIVVALGGCLVTTLTLIVAEERARPGAVRSDNGLALTNEICGSPHPGAPRPVQQDFIRGVHIGTTVDVNKNAATNVPVAFIDHLHSLNANWVGIMQPLHVEDSIDATVELDSNDPYFPSYTDAELRAMIRSFRARGVNVYLTLAFEDRRTNGTPRPVRRYEFGDPVLDGNNLPRAAADWPWLVDHPAHAAFVATFWQTYTTQAVHVARLAQEEGVALFSIGTETDRLFRTRVDGNGFFPNHFGPEIRSMLAAIRAVYSGPVTYDMDWSNLFYSNFTGLGGRCLWKDAGFDAIGVSAYFPLSAEPPLVPMQLSDLRAAWSDVFARHVEPLRAENPTLPIYFTETGRIDSVGAPYRHDHGLTDPPGFIDGDGDGVDDGRTTQARLYQSLVDTIRAHTGLVNGMFTWNEFIEDDDGYWLEKVRLHVRDFSVRGKVSAGVLSQFYQDPGVRGQPLPLLPPTHVAAGVTGNSVTFSWQPPVGSLTPTAYVLEGGVTPGTTLASIVVPGAATTSTVTVPDGTYYVRVHSVAGFHQSVASAEIRLSVNVPTPPSEPANLLGLADGSTLHLAWRNTTALGPPARIQLEVGGSIAASLMLPLSETFSYTNVPPGTYQLSVRAVNDAGVSGPSNVVTLTFPGQCVAPLRPERLSISRRDNAISASWEPPSVGAAPTFYTVLVNGAYTGSFDTTARVLSGTAGPGQYAVSVRAGNRCGRSTATPEQTVTVP